MFVKFVLFVFNNKILTEESADGNLSYPQILLMGTCPDGNLGDGNLSGIRILYIRPKLRF